MQYNDAAWLLACSALSAVGIVAAVLTYRKRGWAAGFRILGWGLLPIAAYLTGLGKLLVRIAVDVTAWVGDINLGLSLKFWIGVALFGVSFLALGGAGWVRRRRRKRLEASAEGGPATGKGAAGQKALGTGAGAGATATAPAAKAQPKGQEKPAKQGKQKADDPLAGFEDIDEILKKRGIE